MINKKNKKYAGGFTLVETLVAVLLLMIAIAGPLTIAAKGLQATLIAKDQDTAFYLAQDAIEYIRWARDTNRLSGGDWLVGSKSLAACVSSDGSVSCYFDSLNNNPTGPTACSSASSCIPINYDSGNGYFTYAATGGNVSATIFTRTVQIITPACASGGSNCNSSEAIASTTVSWSDTGGVTRHVQVREDIFNWQ